jgi:hypothetical protein
MGMEPGNARESELSYVPLDFGFVVKGTGPADVEVAAVVSTTLHESALVPSVLKTAREKGVKPNVLEIGKVPWGERAAIRFEPLDKTWPAFVNGVIGAEALAHATVTLWPERHRIAFRPASTSSFSQSEQDYFFALADRDPAGIARFIESRPRQRLMDEAVLKHLWIRFNNLNSTEAELTGALDIIASNHSEARRSATLLDIADLVEESMHPLREPVVGHALDLATRESVRALEQTAAHEVHLRLGRRALAKGRIDQARSHLLSAAFGKPKDATCNYWLGELYRETGKPRRAWSRYFQALLDEKLASDDPLRAKALQRLDEINGDAEFRKTFDIPEAEQYMDGRLAAAEFHPETRYRFVRNEHPHHARVVELFVNSNGPLGGGLELACQALDEFFEGEVVFISWHLDDPMHTAASRERLAFYQKTSPPLVVIDGEPKFDTPLGRGIIPAEDAAEHYPLVRDACLPETAPETSTWNIDGRIGGNDSRVNVGVTVNGADSPDGLRLVVLLCEQSVMAVQNNGVFFHHFVARDSLTPPAGVDLAEAMRKPLEMEIDIANLRKRLATGRPQADASSGAGAASFVDPRQLFAVALVQRVSDSRVLSARKIVLPESR